MTYGELRGLVRSAAANLARRGISPGTVVGLTTDTLAGTVVAVLATRPASPRTGRPGVLAGVMAGVLLASHALCLAPVPLLSGAAVLPLLVLWGTAGWAFVVPQQHWLLGLRPSGGAAVLALNSSATYLGGSVGAALGGTALSAGIPPHQLPLAAAAVAAVACTLHLLGHRSAAHLDPDGRPDPGSERSGDSHEVRR
ncbi:hypothetical protein OIB37_35585 [Streptomyces sp. NBC_00820]|uniref:hypothetical protein n=1 Tax=Streptomyces sp. NBC_00820 TaxID=2975842 RepID=UPI002ED175A8|nr:hypothetical protein OIB37_35585 [Streptomyces sp. NBC_00820]